MMERRGSRLSRRQFVVGAGGAALLAGCGRLPWQASAPARIPRVGYLSPFSSGDALNAAFRQGLAECRYLEGRNIVVEYRFAVSREDRLPELAAALVDLSVDLIVASASVAVRAAKEASSTILIVMATSLDAVGEQLVDSLARPGDNITGSTLLGPQLSAKRLAKRCVVVAVGQDLVTQGGAPHPGILLESRRHPRGKGTEGSGRRTKRGLPIIDPDLHLDKQVNQRQHNYGCLASVRAAYYPAGAAACGLLSTAGDGAAHA